MGGTGRAPNRRKSPFSGFLARKSRFKASKSFPVPCEIDLYLAQLANSISETSSQLTLPSSGESIANPTFGGASERPRTALATGESWHVRASGPESPTAP